MAGEDAVEFQRENLVRSLQWAVDLPEEERAAWGARAMSRIEKLYSWNTVTDGYENLSWDLASHS